MSSTQVSGFDARHHLAVREWGGRTWYFQKKAIRPYPSRGLKYTGVLLIAVGFAALISGLPLMKQYTPVKAPVWQIVLVYLLIISAFVLPVKVGGWFWNKGATRRR